MTDSVEYTSAASRLCLACGLCCNGAMFETVMLQASDSAKALAAVGLPLKHKRGSSFIQQPCACLKPLASAAATARSLACSIYAARPERCRLFECRQLSQLAAGDISEAQALSTIQAAKALEALVHEHLEALGFKNRKHPLVVRCDRALSSDEAISDDLAQQQHRSALRETMRQLSLLLAREFRMRREPPQEEVEASASLHTKSPDSGVS